jgi:hypothetical protein
MLRHLALGTLALSLVACHEKNRSTDTWSRTLVSPHDRVAFLCAYTLCVTTPADAAFHIEFHDNSGGFVPGPDDFEIHAVLRMTPDETSRWSRGCKAERVEVRPEWLDVVLKEQPTWQPKSTPDVYRCGQETRVIHVKEGLVIRSLSTMGG